MWVCLHAGLTTHFYYLPRDSAGVGHVNHGDIYPPYFWLNVMLGISCPKAGIKGSCSESFRDRLQHRLNSLSYSGSDFAIRKGVIVTSNVWMGWNWPLWSGQCLHLHSERYLKILSFSLILTQGKKSPYKHPVKLWQCEWEKLKNLWDWK